MMNKKHLIFLIKTGRLQKPIIEQFNGRWIKELGDGVMASFNTVSDAVNAAIKIQETVMLQKNFNYESVFIWAMFFLKMMMCLVME